MCKFGCETSFEEGYIGVNDGGECIQLENEKSIEKYFSYK